MGVRNVNHILTELVSELFKLINFFLRTTLPHRWDFCGKNFDDSTRHGLNIGTYIICYAAFVLWCIRFIVKSLDVSSQNRRLSTKDWIIISSVSVGAACKLLWPFFLMSTYFITGSYYPWTVTFGVMYLYYSFDFRHLLEEMFRSIEFLQPDNIFADDDDLDQGRGLIFETSETVAEEEEIATEIPRYNPISTQTQTSSTENLAQTSSNSLPTYQGPRSTNEACPIPAVHQPGSEECLNSTAKPCRDGNNSKSAKFTRSRSVVKIVTSMTATEYERYISTLSSSSRKVTGLEEMTETEVQENLLNKGYEHRKSKDMRQKKGFPGKRIRGDNLSFLQEFSSHHEPSRTRSGLKYGPTVRVLKRD